MGEKLSFTMDAGVILAKLHRGACETHANMTFINTGVLNDKKVKPEQMSSDGDLTFDLEGGEYELGVIISDRETVKFDSAPADAAEAQQKANGEEKGKKGITEPLSDEEKKDAEDDEDKDELNEDMTKLTPAKAVADAIVADNPEEMKKISDIVGKDGKLAKEVKDMVKKNGDAVKKFMESQMKNAAQYLMDYMKVFAGEAEAGKIKPETIAVTYVPDKFADPFKIKKYDKYQIPALTDEEVRKMKIEQIKKDPKATEFELKNMCFKILYQLNVGK